MTTQLNPLFSAYLDDLTRRASALPATDAHDVVADITEHLTAAQGSVHSEAEARTVLDRLGSPAEVVAAVAPAPTVAEAPREDGRREVMALVLLVLAELMFVIWPVALLLAAAGVYCLLTSRVFSWPQKIIALVVLGLAVPLIVGAGLTAWGNVTQTSCIEGVDNCEDTVTQPNIGPMLIGLFAVTQLLVLGWLGFALRRVRR
ncbi:HAAS signaling domain-containing protein [Luteococcus sanguinis]|uniref:DUF1700 domain-containing protein n=1 Tax=Luteococcus sanguinis TaxID=174038 RepID=A0ABW1X139_9ACTN